MSVWSVRLCSALAIVLSACGGGDDSRGVLEEIPIDTDGDFVSDVDEGDGDFDLDGELDYLDLDSDNDGILDAIEAGDMDLRTPPIDSDGDGVPDFRDLDSDDNGLLDADEGLEDTDGDGFLDFVDDDDDGDGLLDYIELELDVEDVDEDGLPGFRDPDSDNDNILDGHEGDVDTDMDGLPDLIDDDSDNDYILDIDEAGDDDPRTVPVDSDADMVYDFRDPDSDNDGISDLNELARNLDPTDPDSDDDDVSDLIEVGAGTDALNPEDNPRTRGDFVFVLPYEAPPMPERDTLEFDTHFQFADVYMLFDTTASMLTEIATMRTATTEIVNDLTCQDFGTPCLGDSNCAEGQVCGFEGTCIENPEMSSCVASVWTGVGTYEGNNNSYRNLLSLQPSSDMTRNRIPARANGGGADEALFESVACVADATVCSNAGCAMEGMGCAGFREEAVRVLVTITDEADECDNCNADSPVEAGGRLYNSRIHFVGIDASSDNEPMEDLSRIASQSDSLNGRGELLVFNGDGAEVATAVTEAINEIVSGVPFTATIDAADELDDDGDALRFIDHFEVNVDGGNCTTISNLADTNGDTYEDAFPDLTPGTSVCWDVVPRMNTVQEPDTTRPLVYKATLTVRGDGASVDERTVYFLVPPRIEVPIGPM